MRGGVRVLSTELTCRGFAFAVLEGTENLVEWGGRRVSGDVSVFLGKLQVLIASYRPDALVFEEPAGSRRDSHGKEWLAWGEQYAADHDLGHYAVGRAELAAQFSETCGRRYPVAMQVGRLFPELAHQLPAPRRPWQSEAPALSTFIAVARGYAALRRLEREAKKTG